METYLIILFLSLGAGVMALVLAAAQARREKAVWLDYYERSIHNRSGDHLGFPRRPVTVVRIDPLELELLLKSPEDEVNPPRVQPSGSLPGTRPHVAVWPEVRI